MVDPTEVESGRESDGAPGTGLHFLASVKRKLAWPSNFPSKSTALLCGFAWISLICFFVVSLIMNARITGISEQMLKLYVSERQSHDALTNKLEEFGVELQTLNLNLQAARAELRLLRMKVNSASGQCDPEILNLVTAWWEKSARVLTLKETIKLVRIESKCDPFAENGPCYGLMQVDWRNLGSEFSREKARAWLMDPETNIRVGLLYLEHLQTQFGRNKLKILTAWRWGPTRTRNGLATEEWARKVLE